MNNKIIILSTCLFLLVSFLFLSFSERKQADINTKNVWMIYFENPKDDSLNFSIENHSTSTDFHWQISTDKSVLKEEDASIPLGEIKTIPFSLPPASAADKKITITVSTGDEKKEIYKSL